MAVSNVALSSPVVKLVVSDGEPWESDWHRIQMNLLIEVLRQAMRERGRTDYFAGGNMFVYYSVAQAVAVATEPPEQTRHYRGPDVFWVDGALPRDERGAWVVWLEDGRYPDLIIELLSPSTAKLDRTIKKTIYERTFRTPDYFMYERETDLLEGFRLRDGAYQPVAPDPPGRWLVATLNLWLGAWRGDWKGINATWLRLFDHSGRVIPTAEEAEQQRADSEQQRADAERQRADAERRRADALAAELARLQGCSN